jgi:D-glycero-alpha-D-manno-heptose-7-phosphate kinase
MVVARGGSEAARRVIRARAPVRLDLAGGWTDVPPFSEREGGAVVNIAINRYCYVTAAPRPRGVALRSIDFDTEAEADRLDALGEDSGLALLKASFDVAREAAGGLAALGDELGVDLLVRCDAPPGSGTGSSASVGVAVAGALAAFGGAPLAPHEAALRAIRAERQLVHIAGGTQDQYAAAHGGANYMTFQDPAAFVSPLRLAPATIAELEKRLVLGYTGVSRVSGDIVAKVMGEYLAGTPRTVGALRRLRLLAGVVKEALLGGDVDSLGEALADNWRCQQDLHPSVTNSGIDALYTRAVAAGAMGGKALGAGGGGCVLFLARADHEHAVRRALATAGTQLLDFSFEAAGLHVWEAPAPG